MSEPSMLRVPSVFETRLELGLRRLFLQAIERAGGTADPAQLDQHVLAALDHILARLQGAEPETLEVTLTPASGPRALAPATPAPPPPPSVVLHVHQVPQVRAAPAVEAQQP